MRVHHQPALVQAPVGVLLKQPNATGSNEGKPRTDIFQDLEGTQSVCFVVDIR